MSEKYIGDGLIGSCIKRLMGNAAVKDVVIFAKGVSSSAEIDKRQFQRELNLLECALQENEKKLVYISTTSASLKQTPYQMHKYSLEK
ncbi:hypothetical protein N9U03_00475, partial [bacterium]|nr:hypothetical protein [bacterium]